MKEIKIKVEEQPYEVSYDVKTGVNAAEFHVVVKDGSVFDFMVTNYRLDTRIIQVEDSANSSLNRDIANRVFDDFLNK